MRPDQTRFRIRRHAVWAAQGSGAQSWVTVLARGRRCVRGVVGADTYPETTFALSVLPAVLLPPPQDDNMICVPINAITGIAHFFII